MEARSIYIKNIAGGPWETVRENIREWAQRCCSADSHVISVQYPLGRNDAEAIVIFSNENDASFCPKLRHRINGQAVSVTLLKPQNKVPSRPPIIKTKAPFSGNPVNSGQASIASGHRNNGADVSHTDNFPTQHSVTNIEHNHNKENWISPSSNGQSKLYSTVASQSPSCKSSYPPASGERTTHGTDHFCDKPSSGFHGSGMCDFPSLHDTGRDGAKGNPTGTVGLNCPSNRADQRNTSGKKTGRSQVAQTQMTPRSTGEFKRHQYQHGTPDQDDYITIQQQSSANIPDAHHPPGGRRESKHESPKIESAARHKAEHTRSSNPRDHAHWESLQEGSTQSDVHLRNNLSDEKCSATGGTDMGGVEAQDDQVPPHFLGPDLWEFALLTKAKTLKAIEKKHNIQQRQIFANSNEPFTDLTDVYNIETLHPAIEQLLDVSGELTTKVISDGCSVPPRCEQPAVTMALNQTRSMYANVLIKQRSESGNLILFAESKKLTSDAIATFEALIGSKSAGYGTWLQQHGCNRDQQYFSKERAPYKQRTRQDSNVDDNKGETPMEIDSSTEEPGSEKNSVFDETGRSSGGNNDSESPMDTDQLEQSHNLTGDGSTEYDSWVIINPENSLSKDAPVSTPDNTNMLENLKTDNFLARDANQACGDERERFSSKGSRFEADDSSLNVTLADPVAERHHPGSSQNASEDTDHFSGTEACGLIEAETNNAADFLTQDEKRTSHGPSQPSSGKFLISMSKKKHLPGHDNQGLQKLKFDFPSGIMEAGLEFSGKTIAAASFTAYLPNSDQGKTLMKLLKEAFGARKLFKTTGGPLDEMRLEPNGVVLKSEIEGESGYPDPTYLDQLEKDLERLGFCAGKSLLVSLKRNENTHTRQPIPEKLCLKPSGNLKSSVENKKDLKGFEKQGTQKLVFEFSAGHDEGGHEYEAKSFTAYLPNSENGKRLRNLLKTAFDQGVLFKIVSNTCMFEEPGCNSLEPNNVSFKSERSGKNGYPDPTYLDQLKKELSDLGFE